MQLQMQFLLFDFMLLILIINTIVTTNGKKNPLSLLLLMLMEYHGIIKIILVNNFDKCGKRTCNFWGKYVFILMHLKMDGWTRRQLRLQTIEIAISVLVMIFPVKQRTMRKFSFKQEMNGQDRKGCYDMKWWWIFYSCLYIFLHIPCILHYHCLVSQLTQRSFIHVYSCSHSFNVIIIWVCVCCFYSFSVIVIFVTVKLKYDMCAS